MKYGDLSREELLRRIEELELLSRQLLEEKEQETRLEYAWTGNLGHWFWNIKTNSVTFHPLKVTTLGYDPAELPAQVPYRFFTDRLHPEDVEKTMDAMRDHLYGKLGVYEAEYRIQAKDGSFKWYYDRGKITQYDDAGKPLFLAGIVFDITEKKRLEQDLEQKNQILAAQSALDGLTQISNHRTLIEHLKSEMILADRTGIPLSVAIFDIDDFKKVNDSKGHIYGDQVLVEIAALLQKNIRETDLVGRYGGEEFLVILSHTGLTEAGHIAERIRAAVANTVFLDSLKITVSGGVRQYHGEALSELIHAADVCLYEAKKQGKNKIVF